MEPENQIKMDRYLGIFFKSMLRFPGKWVQFVNLVLSYEAA